MKGIVALLGFLLWSGSCSKTDTLLNPAYLRSMATLPNVLNESSGLERTTDGLFWSFNDRNGKAELYGFDTSGILKSTLRITNATNIDWEGIACDEAGNLFVGDFGNNDNDRRDLSIYKIAMPTFEQQTINLPAGKIEFYFPEQTEFPPPEKEWQFDIEAMFARGGWLYLLTKDRSKPFVGKTRLYRLPDSPGNYQAVFLAEFITNRDESKGQITAADISPDGSILVLLTNKRLYLFKDFLDNDFFSGTPEQRDLPINRQMEGLVIQDSCTIFLTNEKKDGESGMLYEAKICN